MGRTRLPMLVAATAVLGTMVGCSTDGGTGDAGGGTTAVPSTSSSAVMSGSPSPTAARVIAASALLQPEDLSGAKLEPVPEGDSAHLRPVRPCNTRYPSDTTRTAAVAMQAHVSPNADQTPQVVLQYLGLHPGHAAAAFAEIAAAVRRCPGSLESGQHRWEVAATGVAGDESLLVRVSQRFSYGDPANLVTTVTPVVVARVGDHVMVLADLGWENAGGSEPLVRRLATKAVERLRANA